MSSVEISDQLRRVNDRLDSVNQHLTNLKENDSNHTEGIKSLFVALKGNDLNGGKGFIFAVSKLVEKMEETEMKMLLIEHELRAYKWTVKGLAVSFISGITGFMFWFFTNAGKIHN